MARLHLAFSLFLMCAASQAGCSKKNDVAVTNNTTNPCAGVDAGAQDTACGGACVDVETNPQHCGGCDAACPRGAQCVAGVCGCPSGEAVCSGACANLQDDRSNCGTCSNTCTTGASCNDGECRCPGVRGTVCAGECADLDNDSANCGQCGTSCLGGTVCVAGGCVCAGEGEKPCGATCIDVTSDQLNCGDCGNKCDPGAVCEASKCECAGDRGKVCGGACVDTATSALHCGDCSKPCARSCVDGLCPTIRAVAAGNNHTCALLSNGMVACWGENSSGQLGSGTDSGTLVPQLVPGITDAAKLVAGGESTCVVTSFNELFCWGNNSLEQLTDSLPAIQRVPAKIVLPNLTEIEQVALSDRYSCAGSFAGGAYCWGANEFGQAGVDPTVEPVGQPSAIAGTAELQELAAGFFHVCARVRKPNFNSSDVKCWGDNRLGKLGVDPAATALSTIAIPPTEPPGNSIAVAGMNNGTCILSGGGAPWCWGNGWLANGADTFNPVLVPASGPAITATHLTGGGDFACVRATGGKILCWGADWSGATGQEPAKTIPAAVRDSQDTELLGMEGVVSGQSHTCAWTPTEILCWGANDHGQLGNGDSGKGKKTPRAVKVVW